MTTEPAWYVLQVPPQTERRVAHKLRKGGRYQTLVPYMSKSRRVRGKSREYEAPVFPSYVFLGSSGPPAWAQIAAIDPGPVRPVQFGEDIPTLTTAEVGMLVSLRFEQPTPVDLMALLVEGALAHITGGPFSGRFVRLGKVRGQHTEVDIDILGSSRRVKVPLAQLAAV